MIHLGVNIDHVATVRQARKTNEPDPVQAAVLCELAGADSITVHLRADRRHIQDRDVRLLKQTLRLPLNLEMGLGEDILPIALELRPHSVCLVPERREEVTTEGGLKVERSDQRLRAAIKQLAAQGTLVSLFIEPEADTVRLAADLGAHAVELHTGSWANAWAALEAAGGAANDRPLRREVERLEQAAAVVTTLPLRLHAGHGITYRNVRDLTHLPGLKELNIGHSIISRAVLVGMERAVREMRALLDATPASA